MPVVVVVYVSECALRWFFLFILLNELKEILPKAITKATTIGS